MCSLLPCGHLLGKAGLLDLVSDVLLYFWYFPMQVLYLIVSFSDICLLSYFVVFNL